jgi:hypothetical protein
MEMKIEAGKYYRTRDGRKVGPMMLTNPMSEYPWEDGEDFTYNDIGQFAVDLTKHNRDLIAEWQDDTRAQESNAELAARLGIVITETIGEMLITYDGRK